MAEIRKQRITQSEKIVNDFLLQITYAILASILLMFLYNARLFKYGNVVGAAMPTVLWSFFGIFLALGILYFYMWNTKGRSGYRIFSFYMFATAAGFFWCIGVEKIAYYSSKLIPFLGYFANAKRLMDILFIIIGLSLPVELVIYFIRFKKLKGKQMQVIKSVKK